MRGVLLLLFAFSYCVALSPLSSVFGSKVDLVPLSDDDRIAGGYVGRHRMVARVDLHAGDVIARLEPGLHLLRSGKTEGRTSVQQLMWELVVGDANKGVMEEMALISPPLLWEAHEKELLKGTQLWQTLGATEDALKDKYGGLESSFSQWKTAYAVVRALQMTDVDAVSTLMLVPWISLFSFSNPPNAHFHQRNDSSIEIVMSKAVASGQVVVLNDDIPGAEPRDNFYLFETFGILLSKRRITYAVSVALDRQDPMYGNKRELFDKYFPTKRASHEFFLDGEAVPKELVFALRVFHADVQDFHDMSWAMDRPVSARSERSTWETLGMLCADKLRSFPSTLEEDRQILDSRAQLSRNSRNAILWRRAEKRILRKTLRLAEEQAKRLHNNWLIRDTDPVRVKKDATDGSSSLETIRHGEL